MAHVATLWQVALATDPDFLSPVFVKFTLTQLTEMPFSGLVLLASTNYLARAAYYDDEGQVSAFSASVPFTTLADGTVPVPITTEWEECE